ncbi:MAG: riboflavin synthase [Verrucomicrobiota bacterium]
MFTGIVEEAGTVISLETTQSGCVYTVETQTVHEGVQLGDSIANNGCCLTVSKISGNTLSFDLLEETLRTTNLGDLSPGSKVNLERSLRADARLGGHFVTGHVDGTAKISRWEPEGNDYVLEITVPEVFSRYVVPKGCIAIDGISLTVGPVQGNSFTCWIIPHTRIATNLDQHEAGDRVNMEYDLLAKYTEKLVHEGATPGAK